MEPGRSAILASVALVAAGATVAAAYTHEPYQIGNPTLHELWVDPVGGDDGNGGASRADALRTVTEAWNRIPRATPLSTGYRIQLVAGTYAAADVPNYWEERWGSFDHPVIIAAADGDATAVLPTLNFFDCDYLYLIGLDVEARGGDVLHCEQCDHFLLRRVVVRGDDPDTFNVQEVVKVNQSTHVYIEESDISGGWDNAIDFVAVQYAHVLASRIHDSGDWGMYAKGGSAYVRVEGNEFFDSGTGGFTAGQGTGFEYMTDPYLHYEAYDVKLVNNVVHDVEGAAFGVNGGYDVLMAYNTAYRIGSRSHVFESVFGARSCDGDAATCQQNLGRGGWGTGTVGASEPIPDRHVYVYANIFYNPAPFQSQWQHLQVSDPGTATAGSNIDNPVLADDDLALRGNIVWNGPGSHPLGIEGTGACTGNNPTCNEAQLRADNAINTLEPELVDPAGGDFRPVAGGNLFSATTYPMPSFPGGDWPEPPSPAPADQGTLANVVAVDRDGNPRTSTSPPGAYAGAGGGPSIELPCGAGAHPLAPPTVTVFRLSGVPTSVSFAAYGATGFGTNVASSELDRTTDGFGELLTGPGPGAVYGPHVRAFQDDGTPIAKVSFFAYGTLKYGVGVAGGDLEVDAYDEMVTGAGPGEVFGPHVRGFNWDTGSVTAIAKVSFFAYSTLRYGVNVAPGDVDGDGFAEILTGPGPSSVFAAQLRGFDHDGGATVPIAGINGFVLDAGARFGLSPSSGDVDGDPFAEIGAGSGPDPARASSFHLLGYDGTSLQSLFLGTVYGAAAGGVRAAIGDVDADGTGEIVTVAQAPIGGERQVKGWNWDGGPWIQAPLPSFDAFPAFGAKVGGPFLAGY